MPDSDQSPALREATPTPSVTASHHSLNTPAGALPAPPVQQALSLPVVPQKNDTARRGARPQPLWLSIHLPALPLDALRLKFEKSESGQACAVFEEQRGMRRILLANRTAERQGVMTGLSINAALALVPTLGLLARQPEREAQVLESLAAWAGRFTPLVSIETPDVLLLEIAGSLQLFGGSEALRRQADAGLTGQGFTVSLAIAPTPLAAVWLARSGTRVFVMHTEHLAGALGPLPLQCLQWPLSVCESLNGMGLTSVGDCLRLPRQGFARRFGAARLLQLDRALGRLPDPRVSDRLPARFCSEYELSEEQTDRALLLPACRRLLEALERFLTTRQVAVQRLKFSFFHLRGEATHLTLGCLEPGHTADHWFELLDMKFDRLSLPAPVIMVRLRGGRTQALQATPETLPFTRAAAPGQKQTMPVTRLMERLAAHIGDDCVHGVTAVAEHRPQYAWSTVRAIGDRIPQCALPSCPWYERLPQLANIDDIRRTGRLLLRRPLWMLAEPLGLAVEQGIPHYHGPLRLQDGPERLETGWWDGNGIARDYFVAVNPAGAHLWVYRSRHGNAGWYLHGIFA